MFSMVLANRKRKKTNKSSLYLEENKPDILLYHLI